MPLTLDTLIENNHRSLFPPSFFEDEVRDGFFVSSMMKHYWAAQLAVLAEIDRVCQKHDIPWYIDGGTLLGAVRHKGFIPWDDDVDIVMFRHDLQHFLSVAPAELPTGYVVCDIRTDLSYDNTHARVLNNTVLDTTPARMERYFGCPYTVGIDVFALDGVYPDAEAETERRLRLADLYVAAGFVKGYSEDTKECKALIEKIEKENDMRFDPSLPLFNQLLRMQAMLFSEVPDEGSDAVCEFFGMTDMLIYDPDWFGTPEQVSFEGMLLPAPCSPDRILTTVYGADYMSPVRGGAGHDYPSFSRQEELLKDEIGCNPYRYTLTAQDVFSKRSSAPQAEIAHLTEVLRQSRRTMEHCLAASDTENAAKLASGVQTLADRLDLLLTGQKDIVFMIPRASWWQALAPLYERALALPDMRVLVIPVPWYEKHADGSNGSRHDERGLLPADLPLTMPEDYDIASYRPHIIITCFPYDTAHREITIDPSCCTYHLRNFTDRLIYVPCHQLKAPAAEDKISRIALRTLIEQPAVVFSDEVVVDSIGMRRLYVDTLTELAGEDTRALWEEKIVVQYGTL
ncbi:MAG: LicD family protein [Lachnospiraceae bacterium]|nr:LicD family protein [Lachnospiraceae bacterium]